MAKAALEKARVVMASVEDLRRFHIIHTIGNKRIYGEIVK